jgi:hypothetical protein
MSLINEALKRTRDAAYQPVHAPSPSAPEYRLENGIEPGAPKKKLVATVLIAGLTLGVVILIAWRFSVRDESVAPLEGNTVAAAKQVPVIAPVTPAASATAKTEVTPSPMEAKASEDQIVAKVMEKIKAEQPVAPGEPPKLVLQGITYASDNRDAMIDGVTVHEGEEIEGAHVVTIESRRVKLDFKGQEIILRLP